MRVTIDTGDSMGGIVEAPRLMPMYDWHVERQHLSVKASTDVRGGSADIIAFGKQPQYNVIRTGAVLRPSYAQSLCSSI